MIGKVASNQDTEGKIRVDFDEKSQGYFYATDLCRAGKKEEKEQECPMGFREGDFVELTVAGEEYSDMVGVVDSVKDELVWVRYPDGNKELFHRAQLRKCNTDEKEQEGPMQHFSTGAVRDVQDNKPRPDLVSPFFILRLGEHLRKGSEHYGEHNWEKGIPNSRCFASLMRHLNQWASGETNEDHLAAAAFNLMAIIHNEEVAKKNAAMVLAHNDLLVDMPNYFTEEG